MSSATEEEASSSSPRKRMKLLCSYGGKILPRPADGSLKYVGGETRVIAFPRSVSFSDLHDKIASTFGSPDLVIKYQLMPEDLDALVSVRSDEDLQHMLDEYDRFNNALHQPSSPRFRLFLFSPSKSRSRPSSGAATPPENGVSRPVFTLSTSPTNPIDSAAVIGGEELRPRGGGGGMQRVRSTPNLGELQQSPAAVASPSYLLRHPPLHKYTKTFGVHHGGGAGPWTPASGGVRYDGYGWPVTVQQPQQMGQRYHQYAHHVQPQVGPNFGHGNHIGYGHVEERGGMRSSRPSYHNHIGGMLPPH